MNSLFRLIILCVISLLAFSCTVMAADNLESEEMSEEIIVTMSAGTGPGEYIYETGGGYLIWPRCFAIDPNDGSFYIPESDSKHNLRIHIFDSKGNFVRTLLPEGKADFVSAITIGYNGDIYMYYHCGEGAGVRLIAHYDKNGKLLNYFGAKGPIDLEEPENMRQLWLKGIGIPDPDKYNLKISELSVTRDGKVYAIRHERELGKRKSHYRMYNGQTGKLEWRSDDENGASMSIVNSVRKRFEKIEKRHSLLFKKNVKLEGVYAYEISNFDNELYEMNAYGKEKLEIKKITFKK